MNEPKEYDRTKRTYNSRDEIEREFFMQVRKSEELSRGDWPENSRTLDEGTVQRILQLFQPMK